MPRIILMVLLGVMALPEPALAGPGEEGDLVCRNGHFYFRSGGKHRISKGPLNPGTRTKAQLCLEPSHQCRELLSNGAISWVEPWMVNVPEGSELSLWQTSGNSDGGLAMVRCLDGKYYIGGDYFASGDFDAMFYVMQWNKKEPGSHKKARKNRR